MAMVSHVDNLTRFPSRTDGFPAILSHSRSKQQIPVHEIPGIRVDRFDKIRDHPHPTRIHSHFLTHAHSDHTVGLTSPYFVGTLYCTAVTKRILLETTTAANRVLFSLAPKSIHTVKLVRNFDHLRTGIKRKVVRIVRRFLLLPCSSTFTVI